MAEAIQPVCVEGCREWGRVIVLEGGKGEGNEQTHLEE